MPHDSERTSPSGEHSLAPVQIANHPLFTAREKIALLRDLRSEVTRTPEGYHVPGCSPAEIDEAIEGVKLAAERGDGASMVRWGNNG